ncbi:MAG: putative RDD family membrane protein YckC [Oleiphilaceae bacterium]|jgi:uncharacterized RDD family membrane protein YckC
MNKDMPITPQSVSEKGSDESNQLATRWQRCWAALLDILLVMVVTMPAMYFSGGFDGVSVGMQPSLSYNIAIGLLAVVVFALINGRGLVNNGQTVGKKLLGIRLVNLDGNLATLSQLLKVYFIFLLLPLIPVAGGGFNVINIAFIFGKQKRCLHDYFAGTKVIKS